MIGWLSGNIVDKVYPNKLVLNVNGVGYDVDISAQTYFLLEHVDELISLFVHTVVREDAILLYGFVDKTERSLFRSLIKVNGIGPKVAIGILSSISPTEFIQAIQHQDKAILTHLPGIGKKTAERLLIEMKDSFDNELLPNSTTVNFTHQNEAIHALEALGYKRQEAAKTVKLVDCGNKTCEELIRQSLKLLSSC